MKTEIVKRSAKEIFAEARTVQAFSLDTDEVCIAVERAAQLLVECFRGGHKVLLCGNGGSAADCQHLAAEFVGRFYYERAGWPAIALTTDTSILTAVGNDYGFDNVFSRQVRALGNPGDVLICFSTSGNSANVLAACRAALSKGLMTIGFVGSTGGVLKQLVNVCIHVDDPSTARVQECHIIAGHALCSIVEASMLQDVPKP